MLQDDAVRNLHFDSEIRVAQQTHLEPTVFEGPTSITSQPRRQSQPSTSQLHIPQPIATVAENVSGNRTFTPNAGYNFLADLPSIHMEQSFELNDSLTSITSENRYVMRSPLGDAIFAASESSTQNQRLMWGSARPFQMHLIDRTHQEALVFRKKMALGFLCCQPRSLEVWVPPGNILGRIVQSPTIFRPEFYIEDGYTGQPIFCIEGPSNTGFCCFCLPKETFFKIHSGGDLRASIDHKWLSGKSQYTTNIYFSDSKLTAKERALIMGSAVLLEYMFFQTRF